MKERMDDKDEVLPIDSSILREEKKEE
jgi:hypothetical protein